MNGEEVGLLSRSTRETLETEVPAVEKTGHVPASRALQVCKRAGGSKPL